MSRTRSLLLLILLLSPFLPHLPQARAWTVIPQGYYLYLPLNLNSTSLLLYAVRSNVSVSVALDTSSQFRSFNSTGRLNDTIYLQNGTLVENAALLTPGLYYLLLYSPSAAANVSYYYYVTQNFSLQNSSTYVGFFYTVPPRSTLNFTLHDQTEGSPSNVSFLGLSNETLTYRLILWGPNSTIFSVGPVTALANLSGGVYYNSSLSPGLYYLQVSNPNPSPALAYLAYHIHLSYVNPYLAWVVRTGKLSPSPPAPTGVASFGVYNRSGLLQPYVIRTKEVVGFFNISSIEAYNSTAQILNVSPYEATLQLNAVLQVNDSSGTYYYWPQDVLDFSTNESVLAYSDNVLNLTGDQATLTNSSITSLDGGYVENSSFGAYYGIYQNAPVVTYGLPLAGELIMNLTLLPGQGVEIGMWVIVLQNGTSPYLFTSNFDRIVIHDPNVTAASFVVSGRDLTPAGEEQRQGNFMDAELVFGGGGNGAATQFLNLSASLFLGYMNSSGSLVPFPSYYSFGADTAEASDNVHVTRGQGPFFEVKAGVPDFVYLGSVGNSVSLPSGRSSSTSSTTTSTTSTTTSTSSTTTSTTSTTTSTSSTTSSTTSTTTSTSSTTTGFPISFYILPVVALIVIVSVIVVVFRRR